MALTCYEKKEETIKAELTTLSPLNKVEMMVEELEGWGGGVAGIFLSVRKRLRKIKS